jgi:Gluconate 2-dehydrogenase subunit 3
MSSGPEKTRRTFLVEGGGGLILALASGCGQAGPRQAREMGEALKVFNQTEKRALEALGDALLPGAGAAGIAHYVDRQLASATPLLMLKYVDFPGPFIDFYKQGLAALDRIARTRHARAFADLDAEHQRDLLKVIAATTPPEWAGPPAPLFYFVTRNDAVDVYYGTQEGFARLGIPYMPHIAPQEPW